MRFHYAEAMTAVSNYIPLAQAAEANGYAGYVIPDSLIYPKASDTEYSYTEDGGREFLENKPFVESFIMATAIGTATVATTASVPASVHRRPIWAIAPPITSATSVAIATSSACTQYA